MFFRIALTVIATFFVLQVICASPRRVARETSASGPADTSKSIDDAINSFTANMEGLLKNIQSNEMFQNFSATIKNLGEELQQQGQQLAEKIKKSTDTKTR